MFRSQTRDIVTPQSEHLKMCGELAQIFGNAKFEKPNIPTKSLVSGILLHDRLYGEYDNLGVGEVDENDWLDLLSKELDSTLEDKIADVIIKMHIKRLFSRKTSEKSAKLVERFEKKINDIKKEYSLQHIDFDQIDKITNLCDGISFNFCFETNEKGTVSDLKTAEGNLVNVEFKIVDSIITVSPYPFSIDPFESTITSYRSENYPTQLEKIEKNYKIQSSAKL